jgi:hypothetical protein
MRQLLRRKVLAGFFVAILLLFFSPTLVTFLWHLKYGNSTVYRDKKIPIPLGWIVEQSLPQGLTLMKLPTTVLGLNYFPSTLLISRSVAPKIPIEDAHRSFELGFWTYQGDIGAVSGPFRFGESGDEAFCMKSTSRGPKTFVTVGCQLFHGSWVADYQGNQSDIDSVFQILRAAH